jgi:hypothetical protein
LREDYLEDQGNGVDTGIADLNPLGRNHSRGKADSGGFSVNAGDNTQQFIEWNAKKFVAQE